MTSNHGASAFVPPNTWRLLMLLMLAWTLPGRANSAQSAAPAAQASASQDPTLAIMPILQRRCAACHSQHPTFMVLPPQGLAFDTPAAARARSQIIYRQVWELKVMPLGNITHMSAQERAAIAHWYHTISH